MSTRGVTNEEAWLPQKEESVDSVEIEWYGTYFLGMKEFDVLELESNLSSNLSLILVNRFWKWPSGTMEW